MSDDPRWDWVTAASATCACCGRAFDRLLSPGYSAPAPYPHGMKGLCQNHELAYAMGDILTPDFCIAGKQHFVRGTVSFPLGQTGLKLAIGIWGHLRKPHFDAFADSFKTRKQSHLGPMPSWLANPVPRRSGPPVAVTLHPRDGGKRPRFEIAAETNPLFALQRDGLDFDTFANWMASFGHKIRPRLDA